MNAHCRQELVYYGQEIFELAEQTHGLSHQSHLRCRANIALAIQRALELIDAIATDNLDAIVAPHLTNSTGPAVAGYPNLSLPVGIRPPSGKPAGMLMYSTFLHEPKLIGFGLRSGAGDASAEPAAIPRFVIPVPNADLCDQPRGAESRVPWSSEDAAHAASSKTRKSLELEHASRMTILLA